MRRSSKVVVFNYFGIFCANIMLKTAVGLALLCIVHIAGRENKVMDDDGLIDYCVLFDCCL